VPVLPGESGEGGRVFFLLYRPRGGKTVEARLVVGEDCVIRDIVFSGDFFVYPEEAVERLEARLRGCRSRGCVERAFALAEGEARPLGFTWRGLMERLLGAWEEACRAAGRRPG
jgi:lipoate-protein ligase A